MYLNLIFVMLCASCTSNDSVTDSDTTEPYPVRSFDSSIIAPFGSLDYRIYYPGDFDGQTFLIHVSRGGNGVGDDRGQLSAYVRACVQQGYVVAQIDHRYSGTDGETIARYRGEEISFFAEQIARKNLNFGEFKGAIDESSQGYIGHSAGAIEGLMAAGTNMDHGSYHVPQIKAVYAMSPAGCKPDQFGISQDPGGYSYIGATAIFIIFGEEEKDINGLGTYMAQDWRYQPYQVMNTEGPRYQAVVKGANTGHMDIKGDRKDIEQYNIENSLAFFDSYLRGNDRRAAIGNLSVPDSTIVELKKK